MQEAYNKLSPEDKVEFQRQREDAHQQALANQQAQQEQANQEVMQEQQFQQEQEQEPQVQQALPDDQMVDVLIYVQNMPVLSRRIRRIDMAQFEEILKRVNQNNEIFEADNYVAFGAHITGYGFLEIKKD